MVLRIQIAKFKFHQYLLRANSPNFPVIRYINVMIEQLILEADDALTGSGVAEGTGLELDLTTDHSWLAASLLKWMETVNYTNAFTPHSIKTEVHFTTP